MDTSPDGNAALRLNNSYATKIATKPKIGVVYKRRYTVKKNTMAKPNELFIVGISHDGVDIGKTIYSTNNPKSTSSCGGMELMNSPNFIVIYFACIIIFRYIFFLLLYPKSL